MDGKLRRPVNVCFREAAARHAMADQSPERAVRVAMKYLHEGRNADLRRGCEELVRQWREPTFTQPRTWGFSAVRKADRSPPY